jgi:hypothetical protein
LTFPVTPAGLEVPVLIGLNGSATASLRAAGLPVPPPVRARALLDSGTNASAVAAAVLRQLPVVHVSAAQTHTVAGPSAVRFFEISLSIDDPNPAGSILCTQPQMVVLEWTNPPPDTDVLIGLDLLLEGKLLLDGPARQFTLEF